MSAILKQLVYISVLASFIVMVALSAFYNVGEVYRKSKKIGFLALKALLLFIAFTALIAWFPNFLGESFSIKWSLYSYLIGWRLSRILLMLLLPISLFALIKKVGALSVKAIKKFKKGEYRHGFTK